MSDNKTIEILRQPGKGYTPSQAMAMAMEHVNDISAIVITYRTKDGRMNVIPSDMCLDDALILVGLHQASTSLLVNHNLTKTKN